MIEVDVVDGVVRHAVERQGAVALSGEGEGVVFGVGCRVALAAGEVAGADVAVCAVGVLGVGRVEVGPEAEVLAVGLLVGAEVEGVVVVGVVVVDGGVATVVDVAGGEGRLGVVEFDMRSEDDAVVEHGLDHLVGARHEEVPVAGELVKGRDGGVGGNVDAGDFHGDAFRSFIEIGHHPGVAGGAHVHHGGNGVGPFFPEIHEDVAGSKD